MSRRPYLAGVAILMTLLLSSALAVDWVTVDGAVTPSQAAEAPTPVPAPLEGVVSSSGTIVPPPPPSPEFMPMPLDYVYLDPGLYSINLYPWYYYYSGFRMQHL